jgi:DNA-binding NtrC family response regulator
MKPVQCITPEALEWLSNQSWPENVHQLSDTIWRAVCQTRNAMLTIEDFTDGMPQHQVSQLPQMTDDNGKVKTLRHIQEEAIRFALNYSGGCMTRAAKCLGIGRSTLYRKLDEHQISRANQTTRPMMTVSSASRSKVEY